MSDGMGPIIRLIDVILILLIGFIMVADLDPLSRVPLPRAQREETEISSSPAMHSQFTVHVRANHTFHVRRLDESLGDCASLGALEALLVRYVVGDSAASVVVMPDDASPVQWSVDVVDLCIEHGIEKRGLALGS
jgi:biopolymer transport protein ExbD